MIEYEIRTAGLSHDQNLANQEVVPVIDVAAAVAIGTESLAWARAASKGS
jgi:hypothetical protein